jgi:hypothetical protein
MIEASYIKLLSQDSKQQYGIDVVWPDFNFPPNIARAILKNKLK